ncbi:tRNA(NNU) t(6)A37 threonylcarbamoyladenosine modification; glycation binding protein [[Clostridium] ultunense Esp]|uniref:tRNA N6-adenosine threonylcarbamoyltransferase n=1 Tax=[Clostridium] ultunense Esp TaxID=1288971 RepID=M1Z9T2_9FIRM|nr:tRNA (adenosine(37)-N6)-threonylcarbamoyltransferase complex transferase subunit TsaD [Schnuerera ultunensis]CCQ94599.1 tRNA(NNU) t(6)A37 threonylcarbamoyladenosine modification; glycation binding protein [[Clostridium] ultunense Esp]SHD76732.1 tRNA(NNU) t(6)A37 threonylcarbamoyladenosine modification; glycation binding protein [[Clostridium] ultunense Esp]
MKKDILTLAIETSCDETSCAVIRNGREVLSNIISSQIEIHKKFGGVVPEVASRKHIENMNVIIQQALDDGGISFNDIDLIGVTQGPGLVGALLVGISSAKAIAYALNKPLVGVNHIEGHICANYIDHKDLEPPFTCLIVSGGHTYLVQTEGYTQYELIGRTRDDAAGEAFDKVARALGLSYPGGPLIDKLSKEGNPNAIDFPRVYLEPNSYDFSFSGLKTAVLNYLNQTKQKGEEIVVKDVAASFQQAVIEVLVEKTIKLAKERKSRKIVMAGGVAANEGLRNLMEKRGREEKIDIYYPSRILCTDNAAMVGSAAYFNYIEGQVSDLYLNVEPNLELKG